MTYWTNRPGDFDAIPQAPSSARPGEVYADEGTLIMEPASAHGVPRPPVSSVRPPYESWQDGRGSWVVPAPRSTSRSSAAAPRQNDRGLLAVMGIGSFALLAAFAAAVLAFAQEEKPVASSKATAAISVPAAAVVAPAAPAAWTDFEVTSTNEVAVPAPIVVAPVAVAAPVAPAVITVSSPQPAPVVKAAAAPVKPAPAKPKPVATEKTQREILEDLLEQQLAR